jgi:Lanthionine synthetase C-like protein
MFNLTLRGRTVRVGVCVGVDEDALGRAAGAGSGRSLTTDSPDTEATVGPPGMENDSGICHGTAGNGYAFLKAFERTGDELRLDRARRFAVHALGQVERRGRGRYSLWTGDVGVALFAADCLEERTDYPVLDSLDWYSEA